MDIKSLLLTAGGAALNLFAPGAGTMVHGLISEYTDIDESITPDSLTGDKAAKIISTKLTGEQRSLLFNRKVDLEIQLSMERTERARNNVDLQRIQSDEIKSGKSPRPHAVKRMVDLLTFQVVIFTLLAMGCFFFNMYATTNKLELVDIDAVMPSGEIFLTLFLTPAIVIIRYFTNYSQDRKNEAVVALGGSPKDLMGIGEAIGKRISKS